MRPKPEVRQTKGNKHKPKPRVFKPKHKLKTKGFHKLKGYMSKFKIQWHR